MTHAAANGNYAAGEPMTPETLRMMHGAHERVEAAIGHKHEDCQLEQATFRGETFALPNVVTFKDVRNVLRMAWRGIQAAATSQSRPSEAAEVEREEINDVRAALNGIEWSEVNRIISAVVDDANGSHFRWMLAFGQEPNEKNLRNMVGALIYAAIHHANPDAGPFTPIHEAK